ncbi:hypothetical protein Cgig2_025464 [Carnegiea gigantea]|uniref:Uncharacterized protein n=1 Tax=Carnegiea gigantea TaxID=171969 RepID=A0A9Q1JT29_9CARY|nr:hypothetical protein Cgig2_025464 [Carnegiea gigantea]
MKSSRYVARGSGFCVLMDEEEEEMRGDDCWPSSRAKRTRVANATIGELLDNYSKYSKRPYNSHDKHDKAHKTLIVVVTHLMASTKAHIPEHSFKLKRQASMKMTSIKSISILRNKSSMLRSDKQMFVAPGLLAKGHGKKLYELYASKSQSTSFIGRATNSKGHHESSTIIYESIDSSLMRHSSIRANFGGRDPFNLMRQFPGYSDHHFPPTSPVSEDDIENVGDAANNDDNDDASSSEDDAISSLEDEDLYIPRQAHSFNHALGEPATIAKFKPGEKLPMEFYHNCARENYDIFVRQQRIIVRDTDMCPLRYIFFNDDMEVYHVHVLEHMQDLGLRQALDHVPSGLDKNEWEWLVKKIYLKDPHKIS